MGTFGWYTVCDLEEEKYLPCLCMKITSTNKFPWTFRRHCLRQDVYIVFYCILFFNSAPYWATVSQANSNALFNVGHPVSFWNLWLPLSSLPAWIHRDVNGHLCKAIISACCHSNAGIEGFSHVCGHHEHSLLVWLSDTDMHMTITEVYVKDKNGCVWSGGIVVAVCQKTPNSTNSAQTDSFWNFVNFTSAYYHLVR